MALIVIIIDYYHGDELRELLVCVSFVIYIAIIG